MVKQPSEMTQSTDILVIKENDLMIYSWVVFGAVCQLINFFGVVTNIINIICFTKQGFQDSVNISLLGLAVSDLGSLTTMISLCTFLTPAIQSGDWPFDPVDVLYLTSAIPHFSFTRVSSCITAMITLERCLCITIPLKVKSIITPKRTTCITISLSVVFFCTSSPVYVVNRLAMKFSSIRNQTIFGIISTEDRSRVENMSFVINNFVIPITAFVVILISTIVLSFQLRSRAHWRKSVSATSKEDTVSTRNSKAARMIVMISVLFIGCFVPVTITMLALALVPELSFDGKYVSLSVLCLGIGYSLESVNSSMNIFIYYYMSSKYRQTFNKIFLGK